MVRNIQFHTIGWYNAAQGLSGFHSSRDGNVVWMPVIHFCQIRDRPIRHRPQLEGLQKKTPLQGRLHMGAGWRRMAKHIEVIYTHGVFRPTAPLELELREGQHVIFLLPENGAELEPFVADDDVRKWCAEQAGEHVPSLEDVRQILSKIPGSMADVVIAERDERF
jgi:predicted DNA-binding antitoxin AbrB/MazE fold protein